MGCNRRPGLRTIKDIHYVDRPKLREPVARAPSPTERFTMTNALPVSAVNRFGFLMLVACALMWPPAVRAQESAADKLTPVTVELGDVSLTKLPFIMAADNGIYTRN